MKINCGLNVFLLVICLMFFTQHIRSVSTSQFSVEIFDEEIFSSVQNNNLKVKNTIKNRINVNNNRRDETQNKDL